MNAAMAMDAPKTVVLAEADVLVSPTPMQTAARARAVWRVMDLERNRYWRTATQGVVMIFASLCIKIVSLHIVRRVRDVLVESNRVISQTQISEDQKAGEEAAQRYHLPEW